MLIAFLHLNETYTLNKKITRSASNYATCFPLPPFFSCHLKSLLDFQKKMLKEKNIYIEMNKPGQEDFHASKC